MPCQLFYLFYYILMKVLSIIVTAWILTIAANAQGLKVAGTSAKDIVPEGWTLDEASGDLNKDGIYDLVIIATPDFKENTKTRDDGYVYNFNQPILAIYWGQEDGTYKRYKQYDDILPHREDEYFNVDSSPTITDRGVLKIYIETFASAGSWTNESPTFFFRYQNGDFHLIGYKTESLTRNTGQAETHSYNYLTHKKQVVVFNAFDDNVPTREKWSRIPATPLKKLGSFNLGAFSEE